MVEYPPTNLAISSVITKDSVDVTGKFQLIKVPAGNTLPGGGTQPFDCYYIENTAYFYYRYNSNRSDNFTFKFTNNGQNITITKEGILGNNVPVITNKPSGDKVVKVFEEPYAYIFEGTNGANANGGNSTEGFYYQKDMEWSLTGSGVDDGTFSLDTYFENDLLKAKIVNNNLEANGSYDLTITLEDAGGAIDSYTFEVVFGEQPAVGGFSSSERFETQGDQALNIYFTDTPADFNTGQQQSTVGAVPENNDFPTSTNQTTETSDCSGGNIGSSFDKISYNYIPTAATKTLEDGTGYILINFNQEVPPYDPNNLGTEFDENSVRIEIEYRDPNGVGYPDNWVAATDIEGSVLTAIGGRWQGF
jgi:hypothetical protein